MSTSFTGTSRFELIRRLGEGGFGVVHEAFDRERATRVALKVLRHGEGASLYRFKREFRALADVSHLNLVALDELLTDGHHWFFTMELVRGETIVSYVRRVAELDADGRVPRRLVDEHRLRPVLRQLVDGLTTLHRSGIVHRDVKPPNILVTPEGRLVVLDFGLVSERDPASSDEDQVGEPSTDGLVVLGTPAYMAPEQGGSWQAAPAADWYSVGVVLYEALTGQLPFDGRGLEQLEAKQAGRPRPPCEIAPGVSQDLSDVCLGLLEPDPDLRYGADALLKVSGTAAGVVLSDSAASASEPLFGRESQLRALDDAFEAASRGETVVALVSGASGMGKSALIRHFLNEQRRSEPALITLMSRCYERESMPYKAIDPLVDALARHLQRLRDIEVARLLPRDVGTLARVFPVLLAVEEIKRAPEYATTGLDSIGIRRRAATALRDVLFDIAVRYPLVLAIDDAQWGDADSAAILQEVLRPPDAPPLLLIAAYRSEDAGNAPLVTALDRFARDGTTGQARHIVVSALTEEDSTRLALYLSPQHGDATAFASNIAHESGGSPFFVQELAQHAVTAGKPTRLDDVVRDRVLSLPDPSRRLMTAIALSAQSIPAAVAEAAAEIVPDEREPLRRLRAARLVRAPVQSDDMRTLEPYHDRIREAVIAQLSPTGLSHCHRRLADAWERLGLARPETLTTHFLGAGDQVQAIVYAAQAARRAEETLAFDRAAGFYSLLVRLDKPEQQRRWRVALGDSLVNAGRGYEAALAYLDALELTTGEDRLDLERRAAAELIRAGYLDRARAVLDSLLPKVGLSPPGSPARALATLLGYRALLALRGVKVRERPESAIPLEELRRIDVLVAIGPPLSLISLPHGLSLNIQGTWHALRAGEPKRAAVGLALMASTLSMGGSRTLRKTMRLVEQAKALAEPQQDAWTTARTLLADGIALKVSGHWRDGVERLERAIESFNACPGARWEIETAQTIRHDAMIWTGEWRKLANELPARWHEAEQRGDRYSAAHVAGRLSPLMQLAADRPAEARAGAEAALSHWTKPHFNMQHRAALCTWLDIELYDGRPEKASARLGDAWPALRGTLALFQNGRIEAQFYRARIALALAAAGQRTRLTEATHVARRLSREGAAYATALATLVHATVAGANGRAEEALAQVALAERQLVECDMKLYAAAARYRRGRLMGGDTGRELSDAALTVMREEGIINTGRMIELLTPGPW